MTSSCEHIDHPSGRGAATMVDELASGATTSAALTAQCRASIEACDPALNAFVALNPKAEDEARASDARRREGKPRSFIDGLPVAIKDNLAVAGLPCTWGSGLFADFVPDRSTESLHQSPSLPGSSVASSQRGYGPTSPELPCSPRSPGLLHNCFGSTGELYYSVKIRFETTGHTLLFKPKHFVEAMEYAGFICLEHGLGLDQGNQSHPIFDGLDGPVTSEATGGDTFVYYQNAKQIPNETEVLGRLHDAHVMIGMYKMFPDSYRKETSERKSTFIT